MTYVTNPEYDQATGPEDYRRHRQDYFAPDILTPSRAAHAYDLLDAITSGRTVAAILREECYR